MNIQTEKLELIEWISKLNDSSMIEKIRELKLSYSQSKDWWDSLKKDELESIERGIKDIEEGRTHSNEVAKSIYAKYL
jgi:hypothetical protein